MIKAIIGAYALLALGCVLYLHLGPGHQWVLDASVVPGFCLAIYAVCQLTRAKYHEVVETLKLYR